MCTVPLIWITLQQQGTLTYKARVFGPREYGSSYYTRRYRWFVLLLTEISDWILYIQPGD